MAESAAAGRWSAAQGRERCRPASPPAGTARGLPGRRRGGQARAGRSWGAGKAAALRLGAVPASVRVRTRVRGAPDGVLGKSWPAAGPNCSGRGRCGTGAGAAARERSRVRTLRQAFLALQAALPAVPPGTKLSKLDVLVLATSYIAHLSHTLGQGPAPAARTPSLLHPIKKWPMRSRLYAGAWGWDGPEPQAPALTAPGSHAWAGLEGGGTAAGGPAP
ncbi:transcription factor 23 [Alligator sinensis]|uniref:Transcription factor 23 n=1 Tax=Alligator sinensis TaxID=38654 RepID=A0A1U8DGU9_ALLSI|nr:transcription factor 23 [Alligator sinensis]